MLPKWVVAVLVCLFTAHVLLCEESVQNGDDIELNNATLDDDEEVLVVRGPVEPSTPVGNAVGPTHAVIGGAPVAPHKYRFVVSLQKNDNFDYCGGVLISSIHVLTTSHCVKGLNTTDMIVGVGLHNRNTNNSDHFFKVKLNHVHKNYGGERLSYVNDIALLTLATPITSRPAIKAGIIKLPRTIDENYHNDSTSPFRIIGWGITKNVLPGIAIEAPLLLQGAVAKVISAKECSNRAAETLAGSKICIDSGRTAMCSGDSGGPLFRQRSSGEYEIVGLGSYVFGACQAKNGTNVFTKVSHFLPWIKKAMAASRQALVKRQTTNSRINCTNSTTNGTFCRSCSNGVRWSKKCRSNTDPTGKVTKLFGWV
ncbi:putative Chymotrypsinogen B [Hypsibius exemplaris]|uniref:Chymotrypsinogen B n=1 Tax=Hypsibius exemplaris TaxID=2072580 RepID=A0A9X6NID6_HYPEX|nr:putative Chymotrypsinogen B [Hypsibius exemplaris]